MPAVSVIVPVYNVEKYLSRCVESILAQSYHDFELILIDDGSLDNSARLCDEWASKDSRIKVIHKANGGLSSARNAGLDVAVGEYVTFIDSDDVINSRYLEYLLMLCKENDADISMGRLLRFSDYAAIQFEMSTTLFPMIKTGSETLYYYFDEKVDVSNFSSACCKVYRSILFEKLRFPECRLFEDEFTTYKLFYKAKRVAISDTIMYYYFANDMGITRNLTLLKRCDEYDAQWERICFFQEKNLKDLYVLALKRYLATAQWDLIQSYKEEINEKITAFQIQYRAVLKLAQKNGCVSLKTNFDYFVIAYPKRKFFYRLARKIKK